MDYCPPDEFLKEGGTTVATFLLFIGIAVALSRYFEKKKMHVATVMHALQFLLVFICYLVAFDTPVLSDAIKRIVHDPMAYEMLHDATHFIVGGAAVPAKALIIAWILQIAILAFAVTDEVIEVIKARKSAHTYVERPRVRKSFIPFKKVCIIPQQRRIALCRFLN